MSSIRPCSTFVLYLGHVYLVATDQSKEVVKPYIRGKDTVYSAQIIQQWIQHNYESINAEIIYIGRQQEDPSNFDQMFQWWTNIWRNSICPIQGQEIWVSFKGGVGQTSEAGRVSGLEQYEDKISFFEFVETPKKNRQGIPSEYIPPKSGINYLWNRVQKEALELLTNYNYLAVQGLLKAYFDRDTKGWGSTPTLLKGAIAWNQGQFDTFFKYVKNDLDSSQKQQEKNYWWQAYEQAYTAVIRLNQDNTTEAMLHSFRTIEGLIYKWMQQTCKEYISYVKIKGNEYPVLKKNILSKHPSFVDIFDRFDKEKRGTVRISGEVQATLILANIPEANVSEDFRTWNSKPARDTRNRLSHRLGGIDRRELFLAWGEDISDIEPWQNRLLRCINLITGKSFGSFQQASLLPVIHHQIQQKIKNYQV